MKKNILIASFYFIASTIITWFFIQHSNQYLNENKKILSASIAGSKWTIQIIAAFLLLKEKRWLFIKNIGLTCFIGSLILLPYYFIKMKWISSENFFFGSLFISVLVMIMSYRKSTLKSNVSIKWYYTWLLFLAIAIFLQLKIVFQIL